jgi:hypothetical protein
MYPRAAGDVRPAERRLHLLTPCSLTGGYTNVMHGAHRSRCVVGTGQKAARATPVRRHSREVRHKSHDARYGLGTGDTPGNRDSAGRPVIMRRCSLASRARDDGMAEGHVRLRRRGPATAGRAFRQSWDKADSSHRRNTVTDVGGTRRIAHRVEPSSRSRGTLDMRTAHALPGNLLVSARCLPWKLLAFGTSVAQGRPPRGQPLASLTLPPFAHNRLR